MHEMQKSTGQQMQAAKAKLKIAYCVLLSLALGILWLWLYQRPGFLHADWQEMVYDAKTGLIDDYRPWVVTWLFRQLLYFFPDPYNAQIVFYLLCCSIVGYAGSYLRGLWAYGFILFVFNPAWPVSYSLLDGGVTQLFVASFCAVVAMSSNRIPVWSPLLLSLLRYNFFPVGLLMCAFAGSKKRMAVSFLLLLLSTYTPSGIFHLPVSVEFKYHDLRVYHTGDLRGITAWKTWDDGDLYGPVNHNNWTFDSPKAERTKWHDIWIDTIKSDPIGMMTVKLKKWFHYFSPHNESNNHWAPPSWSWRYGIRHEVGALNLSAPFGDMDAYQRLMPASRVLSLLWSPFMVYAMFLVSIVFASNWRQAFVYSLSPLYFATFILATVNYWTGYWSPSLLASFWCFVHLMSSKGKCKNQLQK